MNHEANQQYWRKGDIVLHDADAKEPKMFMRVVGYTRDGLCKTQYVSTNRSRTIFKNDIKFLHNPFRWGFPTEWANCDIESVQNHFEMVRRWNQKYGTVTVRIIGGDAHDEIVQTVSPAFMTGWGDAMIKVSERGAWYLGLVEVLK